LRFQSLQNTISFFCLLFINSVFAQDKKMERLALQFQSWQSNDTSHKDSLNLLVANAFLNEGNYQSALNINEKIKDNNSNKDMKLFVAGKAEFFNDNYEGSMTFFEKLDQSQLNKELSFETHLLRTLNQIHLLNRNKAGEEFYKMILTTGKDTSSALTQFRQIPMPMQFDLRKARRRSSWLPGSGLYYVGEKRRAFGSFFANALFLGYTGYSIYTQHYITSVLTGVAQFIRFYNGGKRASTKIGYKKNREKYLEYVMRADQLVEKKYFDLKN